MSWWIWSCGVESLRVVNFKGLSIWVIDWLSVF